MQIKGNKKAQSVIESLMTYGWMVLIVVAVLIVVFSLGFLSPSNFISPSSTISGFTGIKVTSVLSNYTYIEFYLTNTLSVTVNLNKFSLAYNNTLFSNITCQYLTLSPGQNSICFGKLKFANTRDTVSLGIEFAIASNINASSNGTLSFVPSNIHISLPSVITEFTEEGLPANLQWWVDYKGINHSSTGTDVLFSTTSGNYSFLAGNSSFNGCSFTALPSSGYLEAGLVDNIIFINSCAATFIEKELPSGTSWQVTYAGTKTSSTNNLILFTNEKSGTYSFSVNDSIVGGCIYIPSPSSGSLSVGDYQYIRFLGECTTTFAESGLPSGYKWNLTYDGLEKSNTSSVIHYFGSPGINSYSVSTLSNSSSTYDCTTTYTPSPSSGSAEAGSTVLISFSASTSCTTTFAESGLPSGYNWNVTYDSILKGATTSSIQFPTTSSGSGIPTYSYSVSTLSNSSSTYDCTTTYTPSPSSGSAEAGSTVLISFSALTSCTTTFAESGLPSGYNWQVTYNSSLKSATTPSSIQFPTTIPGASYSYSYTASATAYVANGGICTSSPASVSLGETYTFSNWICKFLFAIENTQSTSTSAPFQQEANISLSAFSSYEASNLQNVEFLYPNGTVIPSWLESYSSSYGLWWLKIGGGIPANSAVDIQIAFSLPTSTVLFNNFNDGEAPTLSSSYGEYDDGANVFNFYDNFAGTSLNTSKWSTSSIPYTVNNGITLDVPSSGFGSLNSVPTFSAGSVFDFYGEPTNNQGGGGFDFGVGDCVNCDPVGNSWMVGAPGTDSGYYLYLDSNKVFTNYVRSYGVWTVGLEFSGTTSFSEYDYSDEYTVTNSSFSPSPSSYLILIHQGDLSNTFLQWFDERSAPPNGVMPIMFGIVNYVPITISNGQSSATPSPFQQEVVIDSSTFSSYEASNLQNVEFFYPNGTVIPSWLESGSSSSTSSIYWLKLSNVIPADSSATIYMDFAYTSTNLFNNFNDGEAPTLSSSYGEYDDGANVFNFYDNFAGTSLNTSKWSTSSIPYTVNNGITLDVPSSGFGSLNSVPTFSAGSVFDFYGEPTNNNGGGGFDFGVGDCVNCDPVGNSWMVGASSGGYGYYLYLDSNNVDTNYVRSYGVWTVGLEFSGTTSFSEYNYSDEYTVTDSSFSPSPSSYLILIHSADSGNTFLQWFDERSAPPNGVMPSVTVGSLQI
jgi:hypothetical protein